MSANEELQSALTQQSETEREKERDSPPSSSLIELFEGVIPRKQIERIFNCRKKKKQFPADRKYGKQNPYGLRQNAVHFVPPSPSLFENVWLYKEYSTAIY